MGLIHNSDLTSAMLHERLDDDPNGHAIAGFQLADLMPERYAVLALAWHNARVRIDRDRECRAAIDQVCAIRDAVEPTLASTGCTDEEIAAYHAATEDVRALRLRWLR